MNLKWDVIASRLAWRGRFPVVIDRLRARADGREMDYTYLKLSGGAVTVLGLDDENQAVCVRQYRHPTGQVMLELPAGHVDRNEDAGRLRPPRVRGRDRPAHRRVAIAWVIRPRARFERLSHAHVHWPEPLPGPGRVGRNRDSGSRARPDS